jgi:hypothetical protein
MLEFGIGLILMARIMFIIQARLGASPMPMPILQSKWRTCEKFLENHDGTAISGY